MHSTLIRGLSHVVGAYATVVELGFGMFGGSKRSNLPSLLISSEASLRSVMENIRGCSARGLEIHDCDIPEWAFKRLLEIPSLTRVTMHNMRIVDDEDKTYSADVKTYSADVKTYLKTYRLSKEVRKRITEFRAISCVLGASVSAQLTDLVNLKILDLTDSDAWGHLRDYDVSRAWKALKELHVADCDLGYDDFLEIVQFRGLEVLNIGGNLIFDSDRQLFSLGALVDTLKTLILSKTNLPYGAIDEIVRCKMLSVLDMSGNINVGVDLALRLAFTGSCLHPEDEESLETDQLRQLLDWYALPKRWRAPAHKFDFGCLRESLRVLKVSGCSLPEDFIGLISRFHKLKHLDLSDNFDVGPGLAKTSFGEVRKTLKVLDLSNTDLTTRGLLETTHCKKLKVLNIRNNRGLGPEALWVLRDRPRTQIVLH